MIGASAQEGLMWARTASSMLMSSEGGSSTGCVFGAVSGTRQFTQPTIWSGVRPVGGCGQESIDWTNLPDNGAAMRLEYQILVAIALDLVLGDPRWFPHPSFAGRLASANHRCAGLSPVRAPAGWQLLLIILTTGVATAALVFGAARLPDSQEYCFSAAALHNLAARAWLATARRFTEH